MLCGMETHEQDPTWELSPASEHTLAWELSPHTREVGRKGIADVRSILRSTRQDVDTSDHLTDDSESEPKAA